MTAKNDSQFAIMGVTKYGMPPAMLATSRGLAPSVRSTAMHPHDTANRVVRIPLHSRKYPGLYATVDEADAELVSGYRWNPQPGRDTFYAVSILKLPGMPTKTIRMHRLIAAPADDLFVDHENGDGLDNQRSNLRVCTNQQNLSNGGPQRRNRSGYRGVSWSSQTNKWKADICVKGTRIHLGRFSSREDAARAYDAAAIEHFGEFARLNLPEGRTA